MYQFHNVVEMKLFTLNYRCFVIHRKSQTTENKKKSQACTNSNKIRTKHDIITIIFIC